ncbi:C-C motif chemokine 4-like [Pholidichthys leucotaenia]
MTMVKTIFILVTCILLFASFAMVTSQNGFGPGKCCFDFYPRSLPKKRVVKFNYTNGLCSKTGVLFTMQSGAEVCVNPSVPWVKKIITDLEEKL